MSDRKIRLEIEMPDPLEQLHQIPSDPIELLRRALETSADSSQWHRFTGWVRMAGDAMLMDDLGLWVPE